MIFNSTKLDAELKEAGLKIHGCSSNGRVDFVDPPSPEDLALASAIKSAHDPTAKTATELQLESLRAKIRNRTASVADLMTYIELKEGL